MVERDKPAASLNLPRLVAAQRADSRRVGEFTFVMRIDTVLSHYRSNLPLRSVAYLGPHAPHGGKS